MVSAGMVVRGRGRRGKAEGKSGLQEGGRWEEFRGAQRARESQQGEGEGHPGAGSGAGAAEQALAEAAGSHRRV